MKLYMKTWGGKEKKFGRMVCARAPPEIRLNFQLQLQPHPLQSHSSSTTQPSDTSPTSTTSCSVSGAGRCPLFLRLLSRLLLGMSLHQTSVFQSSILTQSHIATPPTLLFNPPQENTIITKEIEFNPPLSAPSQPSTRLNNPSSPLSAAPPRSPLRLSPPLPASLSSRPALSQRVPPWPASAQRTTRRGGCRNAVMDSWRVCALVGGE